MERLGRFASPEAPAFGRYLARERRLRNIPLEEIAEATKIKLRFLEALEADDVPALPPRTFTKGFLRSYANYVGLNADDVVLRFEDFLDSFETHSSGRATLESDRRRGATLVKAVFFLAMIFGLLYLIGFATRHLPTREPEPTPVVYQKNYLSDLVAPGEAAAGLGETTLQAAPGAAKPSSEPSSPGR